MSPTKSRLPNLFNPAMQAPEEIVANFVIRLKEFGELFHAIQTDPMAKPPQHYLLQGQRGYGKSTLLLRLRIEIENDKKLSRWLIPVMFDEEQYGVLNLARLWEEVIEILAERDIGFAPLAERVAGLYDADNPEEEIFTQLLAELRKRKKKLVLLLDNFNDLIGKFTRKEKQRLREVLLTANALRFIGASADTLEFYYDYKEPLFDFFKVIPLNELNREETILLLSNLGETYGEEKIKTIIQEQPHRIDSLRRLTGGVPRTVVLLFEIFVDDENGDSFRDLEKILDRVTPLYKHRLDNLSTQQQAIIDAIAQNWDAVSTKEIAAKVRMPSKAVSAQLNQLEKNQLIRKIPTSTKNHLYQINERFFNIYYLMRLGKRRNRNRVLWLVKFFEICCSEKDLVQRTKKHIQAMREGRLYDKHAYFVSQALARTAIGFDLQDELQGETKKYLTARKSVYAGEVEPSHLGVLREVITDMNKKNLVAAQKKLETDGYSSSAAKHLLTLMTCENEDSPESMRLRMDVIKSVDADAMFNLARLYQTEFKDFEKAELYYKRAITKGDVDAMYNLAVLYVTEFKDFEKAEQLYKMAIEKGDAYAMTNLAVLYETEFKDFEKAEQYYKMAIDKGHADAMNNLAYRYFERKGHKQEALDLIKTAYEEQKEDFIAHSYMAILLWHDDIQGAIKLYESFFDSEEIQREVNEDMSDVLLMLMAKKQYHYLYKVFQTNNHDIRDKYKPIYYALLSLMGEKYADELKKMGDELSESVQDILKAINNWEKAFGQ